MMRFDFSLKIKHADVQKQSGKISVTCGITDEIGQKAYTKLQAFALFCINFASSSSTASAFTMFWF